MSPSPTPPAESARPTASDSQPPRRRRPLWWRIIKWLLISLSTIVVLLMLVIGVVVWSLTPERLTPLVEKYATEYIDGRLTVDRVELTYWSTFPHLHLDIDNLNVTSSSMRGLSETETARLPQDATHLLGLKGLSASINLLPLLKGEIALDDIIINRPQVTLVDVNDSISNYNIFPPSTKEEPDTAAVNIPDISFHKFAILGDAPIRYVSLADSINFDLTLRSTSITPEDAGANYKLEFAADADTRFSHINFNNLRLGMGGEIFWTHKSPYRVELRDFQAGINNVNTVTSTAVDFEKQLTVESLDFAMPTVKVSEIVALIPKQFRGEIDRVKNDLSVGLTAHLVKPYVPATMKYPTMELVVDVPEGSASYEQLHLSRLALRANALINGDNLDASQLVIDRLLAIGEGVGFNLEASATALLSDPHVAGTFKGGVDFAKIPSSVTQMLGATVSGTLRADATFDLRQSYLDRNNFHRIKLAGEATLRNFRFAIPSEPMNFHTREAVFKLGTNESFSRNETYADSLLTASFKVDTLAFAMPGLQATGAGLRAGAGARNTAAMADTSSVIPIGAVMAINRFHMMTATTPTDTMRVHLREVRAHASIKRFHDLKRVPILALDIDTKRARYADAVNRASLSDAIINLTLHPAKPRVNKRLDSAVDSLRRIYPKLPADSLRHMARRAISSRSNRGTTHEPGTETMDFGLDSETRSLLRQWNAAGQIRADRARVFTPYFPLRNRLTDVDLRFNNDSIIISNTHYKVGRSDITIDGTISNLTRALTSRRGNQPLRINMRLTSDTIDVNQLAAAAFAGAAYAEKERQGIASALPDTDNDDDMQRALEAQASTDDAGPLLVPTNIEATLRLNARNVLYSDFRFNSLRGAIEVYDGAVNMRNLSAKTDVGAIDLTALYTGLTRDDLSFAFGMQVRDFHIGRFVQLVPALDSIMPLLQDINGIVNAEVAATSRLSPRMDLLIPSLEAAVKIDGDSLVLLDAETFRKIGKWLLFKNKNHNVIDHMSVKMVVKNSFMELFPFIFDIDRYKLGVFGSNDLDLNFKYHIAVIKSPIPFRFGINVSGTPDKMKIRLGGAKLNEKNISQKVAIADTTRINLVGQIESIFRRGVNRARQQGTLNGVKVNTQAPSGVPSFESSAADTISHADSLLFIQEGLLPAPPAPAPIDTVKAPSTPTTKKKKK